MGIYIARRTFQVIPSAFGVVTLVFLMIRMLPGDPAAYIAGETAGQEAIEGIRRQLGLDKPLLNQYLDYLANLAHLDLGKSILGNIPVTQLLGEAIPTTLVIGMCGLLLGIIVAMPLGAVAAFACSKGKNALDQTLTNFALTLDVLPSFWLGLVVLLIFSLHFGWFPATGKVEFNDPVALAQRVAMGVFVLALGQIGTVARVTRASVLETLGEDYVRTARAVGTPESQVLFKHAIRNATLPIITVIGLSFGRLLGGTLIVETVFAMPGMGTLLITSIQGRDYTVVQSLVMVYAAMFVLVNLFTDIMYTVLDPRVKL